MKTKFMILIIFFRNTVFLFRLFSGLYEIMYYVINLLHHVFRVHLDYFWYEGISGMYCFFSIYTKLDKKQIFNFDSS
jgi:hypothetical protein